MFFDLMGEMPVSCFLRCFFGRLWKCGFPTTTEQRTNYLQITDEPSDCGIVYDELRVCSSNDDRFLIGLVRQTSKDALSVRVYMFVCLFVCLSLSLSLWLPDPGVGPQGFQTRSAENTNDV